MWITDTCAALPCVGCVAKLCPEHCVAHAKADTELCCPVLPLNSRWHIQTCESQKPALLCPAWAALPASQCAPYLMVVVFWYVLLCDLLIAIKILWELTYCCYILLLHTPSLAGCMLLHAHSYIQISRTVNLPYVSKKIFSALLWLTSCTTVTSNTWSGHAEIADLPVAQTSWLIDRCLISLVTEVCVHLATLLTSHSSENCYLNDLSPYKFCDLLLASFHSLVCHLVKRHH